MNVLVTLNADYLYPLQVMLKSLFENNPSEHFSIYMMHSDMSEDELEALESFIIDEGHVFIPIFVDPSVFKNATVLKHFTTEMYYRLIAYRYLPEEMDRILYLDPDIIVLNPIAEFYYTPFNDAYFVASEHEFSAKMARPFNKLRLKTPKAKGYFNTGVLLMNMDRLRREDAAQDIFDFVEKHKHQLLLPDQDVFNALYWDKIIPAPADFYNYDARYYDLQKFALTKPKSGNLDWIKKHTVFIHYCGKQKPWQRSYKGDLGVFFRYYARKMSSAPKDSLESATD